MKKTILLLFIVMGLQGFAQNKDTICEVLLKVRVTNAYDRTPVAGAMVRLMDDRENLLQEKPADADGAAQFTVACGAPYTVVAVKDGYGGRPFPVNIPPDAQAPVQLEVPLSPPLGASPGYQSVVTVVNKVAKDLPIRLGPEGQQQPYTLPASDVWESPPFPAGQKLRLQTKKGTTTNTFYVLPGKVYVVSLKGKVYTVELNK
ncbi:MAG: hypothetical protein CFE23_11885 [Flavobacterium sp. BFFFF1]|uniref:hypothetical protein n=1 Tax=Flavobacterium sp. BFFFF1 TaxID=2015557 RepID=UPI000BCD81B2|nr:hypothetical protein [Flavobacterium sp. BFFFF1]OYU79948.1 MAG: hypothetical protein CFE23_11885 [Flavobacterium sp. BFFFF1]